jgi:leucine dehydrogenase
VELALGGASVAVQGVGSVGAALVELLLESGARVRASDPDPAALDALPAEVERIDGRALLAEPCQIFAPCGPGGLLDRELASRLECRVVCGAANNPLRDPATAIELASRGILYVPDFVANAGGLIHLACALEGGDEAASRRRLAVIPENLDQVLALAKAEQLDPASAAERIAQSLAA